MAVDDLLSLRCEGEERYICYKEAVGLQKEMESGVRVQLIYMMGAEDAYEIDGRS
jgi:hypothetical protein